MVAGYSTVQEASGRIISHQHVKDVLRAAFGKAVILLDQTHGSSGLQGLCIANEEHLSDIHVYK